MNSHQRRKARRHADLLLSRLDLSGIRSALLEIESAAVRGVDVAPCIASHLPSGDLSAPVEVQLSEILETRWVHRPSVLLDSGRSMAVWRSLSSEIDALPGRLKALPSSRGLGWKRQGVCMARRALGDYCWITAEPFESLVVMVNAPAWTGRSLPTPFHIGLVAAYEDWFDATLTHLRSGLVALR